MRIALGIEYDGQAFFGWQNQQHLPTVQGHLEQAIACVANHPIKLYCAGRTDAGVHAVGQVAHFDTNVIRPIKAWVLGVNTYLPATIAVQWAKEVDENFHARFSAQARTYRYFIYNHPIRSALLNIKMTLYPYPLNVLAMQAAAHYLLGEQDFSSFRSSECESLSPMRNIYSIQVAQYQEVIMIEVRANAFLHHMVRNIVGVLLDIGRGLKEAGWALTVLKAKDRRCAAETAPAQGLYLYRVDYPAQYQFPPTFLSKFPL